METRINLAVTGSEARDDGPDIIKCDTATAAAIQGAQNSEA
jgi:hypothetical protein